LKTPTNRSAFGFEWAVDLAGYEWRKGADGDVHLVAQHVPGSSVRIYRPLEENEGLFREFAELESKESILRFANSHGALFRVYGEADIVPPSSRGKELAFGTSLHIWRREAADLAVLVKLWDAIEERNLQQLSPLIVWSEKGGVRYEVKTPKRHGRRWLHRDALNTIYPFKPGDVLLPARFALQMEVNERLAENATTPRLVWTPDMDQQMLFHPPHLLAAMWLQFAQTITGSYQLRKCAGCGRYFQAGPGATRRADAQTCRDSCRQIKRRKAKMQ
jgi:hypothetical protein